MVEVVEADAFADPVRMTHGDGHALFAIIGTSSHVVKRWLHGAVFFDRRVGPGDINVYSREASAEEQLVRWPAPLSYVKVLLEPHVVSAATEAAGLDYAHVEFASRFGERDPLLSQLLVQLGRELRAGAPHGRLYAEQLLQTVAIHLVTHYAAREPSAEEIRGGLPAFRLSRVEDYVHEHLGEEVRLEDLANVAGISAYHFSHQFKATTGETPFEYVIRTRMEAARQLLTEKPWTVARVALEVGYGSPSHFTKLFRRHVGVTPGAYRKAHER